ncbi:unnamed protein product, partial [Didymodactylos carnosus]
YRDSKSDQHSDELVSVTLFDALDNSGSNGTQRQLLQLDDIYDDTDTEDTNSQTINEYFQNRNEDNDDNQLRTDDENEFLINDIDKDDDYDVQDRIHLDDNGMEPDQCSVIQEHKRPYDQLDICVLLYSKYI